MEHATVADQGSAEDPHQNQAAQQVHRLQVQWTNRRCTPVEGEEDPAVRDDKVWDPITAEEERWLELEASAMVKSEETSGLDTAMSKLKVSGEAVQTASTGPENAAVPAGTTDAEEDAPLSARSVVSSGSAFDEMKKKQCDLYD